jgi:hypothetical protein
MYYVQHYGMYTTFESKNQKKQDMDCAGAF